ncbi:hypothetical protein M8818_003122 [Zalaria obscura]|uniref:Uncharacterized protein n=1 Tax=Zalaria obscura TaxID=2024903 RepID=A0ACC3SF51_9PEZI
MLRSWQCCTTPPLERMRSGLSISPSIAVCIPKHSVREEQIQQSCAFACYHRETGLTFAKRIAYIQHGLLSTGVVSSGPRTLPHPRYSGCHVLHPALHQRRRRSAHPRKDPPNPVDPPLAPAPPSPPLPPNRHQRPPRLPPPPLPHNPHTSPFRTIRPVRGKPAQGAEPRAAERV